MGRTEVISRRYSLLTLGKSPSKFIFSIFQLMNFVHNYAFSIQK